MAAMARSAPGTGRVFGWAPVAITTISASNASISSISRPRCTAAPHASSFLRYQAKSSLSFSLKDMAAAALNTPPNRSVFSYRSTLCPRYAAWMAVSMPPMPPPITAMRLGFLAGALLYFVSLLVQGFNTHRPISTCMGSMSVPLPFRPLKVKHAPWQAMQGCTSSSRPSLILVTYSGSHSSCRPTPMASIRPAAMDSAAASGCRRPAQTTGLVVNFLMCSTSERFMFSGAYTGGWAQNQAS